MRRPSLCFLPALLAVFLVPNLFAVVPRTLEKTFPLASGQKASVQAEVFSGILQIETADVEEIQLKVEQNFEAKTPAEADEIAKNLSLRVEYKDGQLTLGAEYSRNAHWTFENWPPVKLAFRLTVPRKCDLDLFTRDGGVQVGEIEGTIKARTYWGLIYFKGVTGRIEAKSEYGEIVVAHCKGDVQLRSISGNFRVGPVSGFADVYGYGGEIEVQAAGGGIKAETSGADLVVGFKHPVQTPAQLRTGGANIILTFDRRSSCDLDLRASIFGKCVNVKEVLPIKADSGAFGKSRMAGKLNAGGPKVDARASGGYVYVQAAPEDQ